MAPPFRIGVMQLTMEPLEEMLESARVDGPGGDGHDLARRGVPVVAQARDGGALLHRRVGADRARDRAPHRRLGDHLARSRATRCRWRWTRASCRRLRGLAGSCSASGRRRSSSTTPASNGKRTLGPMRDAVEIVRGVLGGGPVRVRGRDVRRVDVPGSAGRGGDATRRAAASTSRRPRRRCRRSPARSRTAA